MDRQPAAKFILPFRTKGELPPLFFIHPSGGTVFCYAPLTSYIENRPIYGIQYPGGTSHKKLFTSLKCMATHYMHGMQSLQPKGPYYIAGSSFGATVAFEIAHQLLEQGEIVDFIGSFDGWASYPKAMLNRENFEHTMSTLPEMLRLKELYAKNGLSVEDWLNLQWHCAELIRDYSAPVIFKNITLFKAKELLPELCDCDDPFNGWSPHCKQQELITVYHITGDHYTMFREPNVHAIGRALQQHLSLLQERACVA